jgi:hypothetical protein
MGHITLPGNRGQAQSLYISDSAAFRSGSVRPGSALQATDSKLLEEFNEILNYFKLFT